ncbi:DNA-protecting protein DprA [Rhodococcus spelaei]|uniref:DNA-protecting protein DprA n=1 Tax=Rhodococcus spelaei TaxID=2546320 RepID=A0A541B452_9NOCA|nr:DNA-processing protein DprA [Rhodococcus spelaei]TQF67094.1 DNA-protecting protein DprA [Rhodococcus spelaei]
MNPRRAAWAYLSQAALGPCAPLVELVAAVGPEDAARAVRQADLPEVLRSRTAARRDLDTAERDLAAVERLGGRLLTPDDDDWPAWKLLAFDAMDQRRDRECAPPLALWVLGSRSLTELTERAVAVVGTRAATGYGEHVTTQFVDDLAGEGWTVVSGAAYGVDGAAHRAALAAGAPTVAVLACGVDRAYPAGHARLLREIAREGAVLSEYPPGTAPARHRFLARNRLVAGLSDAVLVVEAGARSGARNTAVWAAGLGRPVLAVPGPVTSASSVGCHRMIRDGEAVLASRAADVSVAAGPIRAGESEGGPARPLDGLSHKAAVVYEAFPASGSVGVRQLSEDSGLPVEAVRGALPVLELEGLVGSDETGWFRRG